MDKGIEIMHDNRLLDRDIRQKLHSTTLKSFYADGQSKIVDEFTVGEENTRIDIAVINGRLHGYEIKSDADNLDRLPTQITAYNKVFDYLYLVVSDKYVNKVFELIPSWWGVIHITNKNKKGNIKLSVIKDAECNNFISVESIANLLWCTEAKKILKSHGYSKPFHRMTKKDIISDLISFFPLEDLQHEVRKALKIRLEKKVEQPQTQYVDLFQSQPMYLNFQRKNLDWFLSR